MRNTADEVHKGVEAERRTPQARLDLADSLLSQHQFELQELQAIKDSH